MPIELDIKLLKCNVENFQIKNRLKKLYKDKDYKNNLISERNKLYKKFVEVCDNIYNDYNSSNDDIIFEERMNNMSKIYEVINKNFFSSQQFLLALNEVCAFSPMSPLYDLYEEVKNV